MGRSLLDPCHFCGGARTEALRAKVQGHDKPACQACKAERTRLNQIPKFLRPLLHPQPVTA